MITVPSGRMDRVMANIKTHVLTYFVILAFAPLWEQSCLASDTYAFAGEDVESTTGLSYNRERFYDPDSATFISKDPLGVQGGNNAYRYVRNNPTNEKDPLGTQDPYWYLDWLLEPTTTEDGQLSLQGNVKASIIEDAETPIDIKIMRAAPATLMLMTFSPELEGVGGLGMRGAVPLGFTDAAQFSVSADELDMALAKSGITDGTTGIRGSSVTGVSYSTGLPFDGGGVPSDLDFYVESAQLTDGLPTSANIPGLVYPGTIAANYDPIAEWAEDWSNILGRNVSVAGFQPGTVPLDGSISLNLINDGQLPLDGLSSTGVLQIGGVIINEAATLVGENLSDIKGATYDPNSKQIVFLGSSNVNANASVNMDYFFTAINAVYGSSVPPYVSLDFPATPSSSWTDYGNGDGTFENGEVNGFVMRYDPLWANVDTTIDVPIVANWNGTNYNFTLHFQAYALSTSVGGRQGMGLLYTGATNMPAGLSLNNQSLFTTGQTPTDFSLTATSQDGHWPVQLYNNSGHSFTVTGFAVIPARQHREYGGRVDGTRLGWVMYEADRVMKCLAVGKDNLTGATYSSTTVNIPGFQNMLELDTASGDTSGFSRMWFEPNQMTLQRYVDPVSGQATIDFQTSTVSLLTEAYLQGQPSDQEAQTFANFFQNNYDSFATLQFPVLDPTDPTSTRIIQAPIFAMLKQAMQAVSLARFFHDNNIPLDTSWMSTYQLPVTYTPKSVPTVQNQGTTGNQLLIYGGVDIITPNGYVQSSGATGARGVGQSVLNARPSLVATPTQDIKQQSWSATTSSQGTLNAVATSLTTQSQIGNVHLAEHDVTLRSPGALPLSFARYYQSSYLGQIGMGPGWRYPRYSLQFTNPSWFDQNHYMKDASGTTLPTDTNGDTKLRSGTVSFIDLEAGTQLDFQSSLLVSSSAVGDAPVVSVSGLGTGDVPTFTSGQHQNASTLVQQSDTGKKYLLTFPDGSSAEFDSNGRLLETTDRHKYTQYYGYDSQTRLSSITDSVTPTPQVINFGYDPTTQLLISATGPNGVGVTYHYDASGRLTTVVDNLSGVALDTYGYNTSNQLTSVTRFDGTTPLSTTPDLKGRSALRTNARNDSATWSYFQNTTDGSKVASSYDPTSGVGTWEIGSDASGRTTYTKDPLNNYTTYGYSGTGLAPTSIQLPTPSDVSFSGPRPPISIVRNNLGYPSSITDAAIPNGKPVKILYSNANLPTHVEDTSGRAADLGYDGSNNLQTVTTYHNGQALGTTLGYQNEFLHSYTDPLNHQWTYGRDNLGRLTSVTDPTNVTVSYDYDSLGRLSHVYDPKLSSAIHYQYDNLNRVSTVTSPSGTTTYAYDPVHQWVDSATTETTDGHTTSVQYTHNDQTADLTSASTTFQIPSTQGGGTQTITTNYGYDSFGNLQTITPPNNDPINYTVNSLGQITGTSLMVQGPTITASAASSGVWTNQNTQNFSWSAVSSGTLSVTGYSVAEDSTTSLNVTTTLASTTWRGIFDGQHTFRVRAQYSDGSWSAESLFNLWVDTAPPLVSATTAPMPIPAGNASVTITANIIDPLSDQIDGLINSAGTASLGNVVSEQPSGSNTFLGGNMDLFSSVDDVDFIYARNTSIWTGNLDWSGVSVYRVGGGTYASCASLVTPTDAEVANHCAPGVGTVLIFVDNKNVSYRATVAAVTNVQGDLSIAHLTWSGSTPTTLKVYTVFPAGFEQSLPSYYLSGFPIIGINQFRQIFCQDSGLGTISPFTNGTFYHQPSSEQNRLPYTLGVVSGDSSYPLFEIVNGQPILLGTNYGMTQAPSIGDNVAAVNAAIAAFSGDPYSLTTYTVSSSVAVAASGVAPYPQFRWCLSGDSTRNWSSYSQMSSTSGQWTGTISENGSEPILYYQILSTDAAGNSFTYNGSANVSGNYQDFGYDPVGPLWYSQADGYLYGVNAMGGPYNQGTVYRLMPDGSQLQLVYAFQGPEGAAPTTGLIEDSFGNLWGATSSGGSQSVFGAPTNNGTVFKLTKTGVLVDYGNSSISDRLVLASTGTFYGDSDGGFEGNTGIFSMTPQGNINDMGTEYIASVPGSIMMAADGYLYNSAGTSANGYIARVSATGSATILWNFQEFNGPRGAISTLTQASNGAFFGTSALYYDPNNIYNTNGSVFTMAQNGVVNVIQPFSEFSNRADPVGDLVQAGDGNIYGVSQGVSAFNYFGEIWKVSPAGGVNSTFSDFIPFQGTGLFPLSGLINGPNNTLYGTAGGGSGGHGAIYSVPLTPGSVGINVLLSFAAPPSLTGLPASLVTQAGSTMTLTATGRGTVPSYQWQVEANGSSTWVNLSEGSPYTGTESTALTVTNAQLAMSGNAYRLTASNAYGNAASSAVNITVVPSIFTQQPTSQNVTVGSSVTFSAAVSGATPFTYQWQFNGVNIPGATSSSYTITSVTTSNAGNYTLIATNIYGSSTSNAAVLSFNVPGVDTPTMPTWALILLAAMLASQALYRREPSKNA